MPNIDFWPGFCAAAEVFCIREVFTLDAEYDFHRHIFHF